MKNFGTRLKALEQKLHPIPNKILKLIFRNKTSEHVIEHKLRDSQENRTIIFVEDLEE